ncbi:MAG: Undecaprenyl-diphosphatase [Bacteroidota bacterium]|jgi:undecaprenyl-diphosphatase
MEQLTYYQAIVIAIVEGLTEFLPISSTAHMKFTHPLLGVHASPFSDMFEVVIQLAAIVAVVVIYYKKFFNFSKFNFFIKLFIALIPSILVGLFLKSYIDSVLDNLTFIAVVMVVGGILLLFIEHFFTHPTVDSEEEISNKSAFLIGCGQVLAVLFPGLSRSAATILSGMSLKLTRSAAAEFSFFLAVPTMAAASIKSFWDTWQDHPEVLRMENLSILTTGSVVAFVVALLAIKFFISFVKKYGFRVWGYYRIIIGLVMLALIWSKTIA